MEQPIVTVEQNKTPVEEEFDTGKAFAELVNGKGATATDPKPGTDADNADETVVTPEVTAGAEGNTDHDGDQPVDPWASAPEELRTQFNALQAEKDQLANNVKAQSGRVSGLTKKLERLSQQASAQPLQLDIKGKGLDELQSDFPEITEYVQDHVNQALTQHQQLIDQRLAPLADQHEQQLQREQQAAIEAEAQTFAERHPDHADINKSTEFWDWYDGQPPAVQALRTANAGDNIAMLDLYKQSSSYKPPQAANNNPLSEHLEAPRKGAGRAAGSEDDLAASDPGKYFQMITQRKR